MTDTTPERSKAAGIRERYTAAATKIRKDPDLTDDARHRRLVEEWKAARTQLDTLQTEERLRLAKREQELERRVFGVTSSLVGAEQAISTRDAQDRASRITTPTEANQLLSRAERNGDRVLAQAVAHHAVQKGRDALTRQASGEWDTVLGSFFEARPHLADQVEELAQIERLSKRQILNDYTLPPPAAVSPVLAFSPPQAS